MLNNTLKYNVGPYTTSFIWKPSLFVYYILDTSYEDEKELSKDLATVINAHILKLVDAGINITPPFINDLLGEPS